MLCYVLRPRKKLWLKHTMQEQECVPFEVWAQTKGTECASNIQQNTKHEKFSLNLGAKTNNLDIRPPFSSVCLCHKMNELKTSHHFWRWYCVSVCALTCVHNTVSNKSQVIQVHREYSSKMIFIFAILIRETQLIQDRINAINVVSTISLSFSLYWRL